MKIYLVVATDFTAMSESAVGLPYHHTIPNEIRQRLPPELRGSDDLRFAHFSALGTWEYEREPCTSCGWHWQHMVPPMLVQWEPSSDVIGDFSWDGPFLGSKFLVKDRVVEYFDANRFKCDFLRVDYVQPDRKGKQSTKCVAYPYNGPTLRWCRSAAWVALDMEASGVSLESSCSVCGDVRYTFRYNGIVIRRCNWDGQKMFRITTNGRAAHTFVTTEGQRLIKRAGFSNIAFSEAGTII